MHKSPESLTAKAVEERSGRERQRESGGGARDGKRRLADSLTCSSTRIMRGQEPGRRQIMDDITIPLKSRI